MRKTLHVTSPEAARAFGSPRTRQLVLRLIPREHSSAELSRGTGLRLNLLHYHLAKLVRLGLVEVTRREPRAGAPVAKYRAVAEAFFVPAELLSVQPGEAMAQELRQRLAQSLARSLEGLLFTYEDKGPRMRQVRSAPAHAGTLELWAELHLSAGDAAELAGELRALFHRFEAKARKGRPRHLLHAALVRIH